MNTPKNLPRTVYWCAAALFLCVGIGARAQEYAAAPPLRVDEIRIALNVLNRSFGELIEPLDHRQGAPLGFLWLTKGSTLIFGRGEYALRLVPFLAGAGALVLFSSMSRHVLDAPETVAALFLFALAARLIQFSYDVKQYSTDVLAATAVITILLNMQSCRRPVLRTGLLAVIFVTAIVLSHSAIFVVAAALSVLLAEGLAQRDWHRCVRDSMVAATCFVAFAVLFLFNLRSLTQDDHMQRFWQIDFAPLPSSFADLRWFNVHLLGLFVTPGLRFHGLAALLAVAGATAFVE